MKRLAIVTTHPIQYNAPLFQLLNTRNKIEIRVFYTWGDTVLDNKYDPGFGQKVQWDIPLLEGYAFEFVKNISKQPRSHHFKGIDNPTLINAIEEWDAEAILIFGWNFKSHLKAMRYFHNKIPVFFRGDSTLLDRENGFKEFIKKKVLNWVYHYIDKALYVGEENRKYFKYAGLKDDQMVFAPHAIDNNRFRFDVDARQKIRSSLSIPDKAVVFLFAGKLEPKKNPALLLKVFEQWNNGTHLIIAGNGVLEETLKSEYGANPQIHFIPFQNQTQMPGLYSACDVFVLPSQGPGETWGLSVNEAMACGKPVLVSSKCGCAVNLVQDNKNGFTFESGNERGLLQKMQFLLEHKERLSFMGNHSLEIIEEWNYQNVCQALEGLINN